MSTTLTKGFIKPATGDGGASFFPDLETNIQKLNDHTHNGTDSYNISNTSIASVPTLAATVTTSKTIDWSLAPAQSLQLTTGSVLTMTAFTNPSDSSVYVLHLKQPASGAATTVVWSSITTIRWPYDTAPVLSTSVGKTDIITFIWDGTHYMGSFSLGYTTA